MIKDLRSNKYQVSFQWTDIEGVVQNSSITVEDTMPQNAISWALVELKIDPHQVEVVNCERIGW